MSGADGSSTLTARGAATRERILDTAAELFYDRGVQHTTNDDIRRGAKVSGSQLNHYFPTRAALVSAVLKRRVADATDPERFPGAGLPHSLSSLRGWADIYLQRYETLTGGCRVGSLAAEIMKSSAEHRDEIAAGYESWRLALRDGFSTMKQDGELVAEADVDYLSLVLLSALQGGLLLTQASGDTAPLRAALDGATRVVLSYAAPAAAAKG